MDGEEEEDQKDGDDGNTECFVSAMESVKQLPAFKL